MHKKYIVRLTAEERSDLDKLVNTGKAAARKRLHAQILLKADVSEQGDGWGDAEISKAFDTSTRTVERVRRRFVEQGLDVAINRAKPSRTRRHKLDGEQEAHLIALVCSGPPDGYANWTLRLLANKMVELEYIDDVSHETVRTILKKRNQTVAKKGRVYTARIER